MTARSFCYACLGIFLLAAAWTMGAQYASADFNDSEFPVIGVKWDQNIALRADGTLWECDPTINGWREIPGSLLPPGVAVSNIGFWNGNKVITKDGEMWFTSSVEPGSAWISCGQIPLPTVAVEPSTMSDVKSKFEQR